MPTVLIGERVRRMTPGECLSLQGFDSDHLGRARMGGSALPDTARYRLAGNSWCVPLVRWVLSRIDDQLRLRDQHPGNMADGGGRLGD